MRVFIDASPLIYLNTIKKSESRKVFEQFYEDLVLNHRAFTDALVLDELLFISKRKYGIPFEITLKFVDSAVLDYAEVLPLGKEEYRKATEITQKYAVYPSDALHIAAMLLRNVPSIATEDAGFDKVKEIERVWVR